MLQALCKLTAQKANLDKSELTPQPYLPAAAAGLIAAANLGNNIVD
jgi:hypothetical protein